MSAARIRERLAAVVPGQAPPGLIRAAVLVPLLARPEGTTAIFTRRADHLSDHAGQISFPGGRVEAGDRGPVATALREAREEIGLAADRVEILGRLPICDTTTGFAVIPVVGQVTPPVDLTPDPTEVAEIFEVPLAFLLDPANRRLVCRPDGRETHVLDYDGRIIWGATARMIVDLGEVIGPCAA